MAEAELHEAARYYQSEVSGLGEAFIAEVEYAVRQIREYPEAAPLILKVVRRKLIRRFPYSIMYSFNADSVRILAIANQNRRPFYWSGRK